MRGTMVVTGSVCTRHQQLVLDQRMPAHNQADHNKALAFECVRVKDRDSDRTTGLTKGQLETQKPEMKGLGLGPSAGCSGEGLTTYR